MRPWIRALVLDVGPRFLGGSVTGILTQLGAFHAIYYWLHLQPDLSNALGICCGFFANIGSQIFVFGTVPLPGVVPLWKKSKR
jgi:hypothetical protein